MAAARRLTPPRIPAWTLLLCGAAGIVFTVPELQALLIYSRAAIGDGELWRLVTGSLVHFSPSHLAYNIAALFIVGGLIETLRYRHFATLCMVSGALIGLAIYVGKPEIFAFGGLSGVVTASVTFLCLHGLHETGAWRRLCQVVLVCVGIKITTELVFGPSLLAVLGGEDLGFVPLPLSHFVGAVTAALVFFTGQPRLGTAAPARPTSRSGATASTALGETSLTGSNHIEVIR